MLALALIASHLVGDFVFQTRWQSAGKFGWTAEAILFRLTHVVTYTLAFVPVAVAYTWSPHFTWRPVAFLLLLALLHFLTDAQRFTSTLGDVIGWRMDRDHAKPVIGPEGSLDGPCPPNPWPPIAICIDQTLHLVQLAVLGWLLT